MPGRTLRIYRVADTDLRNGDPGAGALGASQEEVVKLVDVEHAIDCREERLRHHFAAERALVRLISTLPGYTLDDPLGPTVLQLVEEVEHLRKLRDSQELVEEP